MNKEKEALNRLKHNESFDLEYQEDCEAIGIAIEALEKADKYRWHDLRKNPDDLPEMEMENWSVNVLVKRAAGRIAVGYYDKLNDSFWTALVEENLGYRGEQVIGWKYIEPFEV